MTGRDVFGVVVRSIGLLVVLYGAYALAYAGFVMVSPDFKSAELNQGFDEGVTAAFGLAELVAGLGLLIYSEIIVAVAYRHESRRPPVSPPGDS